MKAHDLLTVGAVVHVQNMIGVVVKAEMVPACNGGQVALHTIRFDTRKDYGIGGRVRLSPLKKPIMRAVNYAFIQPQA